MISATQRKCGSHCCRTKTVHELKENNEIWMMHLRPIIGTFWIPGVENFEFPCIRNTDSMKSHVRVKNLNLRFGISRVSWCFAIFEREKNGVFGFDVAQRFCKADLLVPPPPPLQLRWYCFELLCKVEVVSNERCRPTHSHAQGVPGLR